MPVARSGAVVDHPSPRLPKTLGVAPPGSEAGKNVTYSVDELSTGGVLEFTTTICVLVVTLCTVVPGARLGLTMMQPDDTPVNVPLVALIVAVVPEADAVPLLGTLQGVMRKPPLWWPQLTVWSEGDVADTYGAAK